ncbi:MAG: long-chain fatty acid--CoA ligase [Burkholderia sp.]|nr:long-chain fatty acid--CoA ligase [Burkholderia sp.]
METTTQPEDGTFPRLLLQHAQMRPNQPAFREKDLGIWQTSNWAQVGNEVRALACGLAAMGFRRGMNLAIIGDNRPRLYWAMAAAQWLGGVAVPLYQDAPAVDMAYVLENAEVEFVIAEDQEQVDKLLEIRQTLPGIAHIVFDDDRGMRHYQQPGLVSYEKVQQLGREFEGENPYFFMNELNAGAGDDVAIMLYTSGTTGKPKGVCLTHEAMITAARGGVGFDKLSGEEDILSYLPMAWVGDNLFSYAQQMVAGYTVNCPESGATVTTDMREIGPTYYFAPPRIFENMLTIDPLCHRRPVRSAPRHNPLRPHQHAHQALDGACRPDHQDSRDVCPSVASRRNRTAPSRDTEGAPDCDRRNGQRCNDAPLRSTRPDRGRSEATGHRGNDTRCHKTAWRSDPARPRQPAK